jgi:hypothetical protein
MTILAFLQNMWVRDPERVKASIALYGEEHRRRLITYALFAGCRTGRRLRVAFGPETCKRILWEEASPEISGDPRKVCRPDHDHIRRVLLFHRPDIVLAFGHLASAALAGLWDGPLISAPHPAARQTDVVLRLNEAAAKLAALEAALQEAGT